MVYEEEATAQRLLNKIKFIGSDKQGLFLLDRELGMRSADNQ